MALITSSIMIGGKEEQGQKQSDSAIMNYAADEFIQFIKRGLQKL
jgi:hypothetical protein